MNLKLIRNAFRGDGIFGTLTDQNGKLVAVTLEHAFSNPDGTFSPITPVGTYTCQRGQHQLANMIGPFTTFEITNVPGHTGVLFHVGNYNTDSSGCCLLGASIVTLDNGSQAITSSRLTFEDFMALQTGIDQFILTVA